MKLLIMKSSPSLLRSFLLGLNIFLSALFSYTLLSLCSSVLHRYCPVCTQLILRVLLIIFFLAFLNFVKISAGKALLLLSA